MEKPSWSDAPEWAKYLAMDANGEWWWYEGAPLESTNAWRGPNGMRVREAEPQTAKWAETLESRP